MLPLILADPERRFLVTAICATLFAISIDNWVAPAVHNHSPFSALGFFLALISRKRSQDDSAERGAISLKWAWVGVALFALLHVVIIAVVRSTSAALVTASGESTVRSGAIASLKLLVLLPTLALVPPSAWKQLARKYKAELIASALVLFTWNPFRMFVTAWPWYSDWLGRFAHVMSGLLVAGLGYVPGAAPTLAGPKLDVSILFGCSGLSGIRLFQVLFGLVVLVDWNRLKKMRVLAAYFAGLAATVLANALRIALLVVLGNQVSPDLVMRFHINAGGIFFTSVFLIFLAASYRWLLKHPASSVVAPQCPQS